MSLINDALRRANQTSKQPPTQPSSGAPMRAVEPSPKGRSSLLPIILTAILAICLGAAGWFFWMSSRVESKSIAATKMEITSSKINLPTPKEIISANKNLSQRPVAPSAEAKAVSPPQPSIPITPEPTPAPVESISPSPPSREISVPIAPVAAPTPPSLKLQGIFYRASNPTALINGKTVGIGESVSDARVVSITTQQVTLEWNAQKIFLNFGNP